MSKIRTIIIARIGNHRTIKFAADELRRYLKLMDGEIIVDVRLYDEYEEGHPNFLWVGMSDTFEEKIPAVEDKNLDDAILIDVHDFCGVITANNIRSVLVSAYRFLRELGVKFVHQGPEGEIIPKYPLDTCDVHVCEAANSRYRGVCLEGAVAYEHIYNMIDWLPKVGFNSYELQFMTPMVFLNRWNEHTYNASIAEEPMSRYEAAAVQRKVEEDIAERSLMYFAVGHSWTSEAVGVPSNGWDRVDPETVPEEARKLFALISGNRTLFKNIPASTQLCYSNPKAIEILSKTIADYAEKHPEADYVDVFLADSSNNFCECENCRKLRPSDWYVEMLNRTDEILTERGVKTKIGMCAYNELLWAPLEKKIKNPSRFFVFYAPITRPYTVSYDEMDMNDLGEEPPYELNKLKRPSEMRPLVKLLDLWQKQNPGLEWGVFDYHMWFTNMICDPGRFAVAKMVSRDIKAFPKLGLKGLVSCQIQRVGFPTNLTMRTMAETLWDGSVAFDTVCKDHLSDEFGAEYAVAREYLEGVSDMIAYWPDRLAEPDVIVDDEKREAAERAIAHIAAYKAKIEKIAAGEFEHDLHKRSWENLLLHTEIADVCARLAALKFAGKSVEERKDVQREYHAFFRKYEPRLHRTMDLCRQLMNTGAGAE